MSWKKILLIPQLVWYRFRAPRDPSVAWDQYWRNVRRTGAGGDVLWDASTDADVVRSLDGIVKHMDRELPIVDVGCGNGRYARAFAAHFPKVLGIDVSPTAVDKAGKEAGALPNVSFRVLDMTVPGAGRRLVHEIGEANVFSRGVLHILDEAHRGAMLDNVRDLLGRRGVLYFLETDIDGGSLDYLESVGVEAARLPEPLRLCAVSGLAPPRHFGDAERNAYFAPDRWETIASGPIPIPTLVNRRGSDNDFPGYFAAMRPRG